MLLALQEMADKETIDISHDAVIVLKHHGSYMQQNRDLQRTDKAGYANSYQFMLRLKVPCGKLPASVYKVVDDISDKWGQGDIRATTRQAWQVKETEPPPPVLPHLPYFYVKMYDTTAARRWCT